MQDQAHIHRETKIFLNNRQDLTHIYWTTIGANINPMEINWVIMQQVVNILIRIVEKPENANSLR